MITAEQVKEITINTQYQNFIDAELESRILTAALNHEYSIKYEGELDEQSRKFLEKKGYKVVPMLNGNTFQIEYTTISWSD